MSIADNFCFDCYGTSIYDLCPESTAKRGRPRNKGLTLIIRDLEYTKEENYYIAFYP
jgi:hypothetical protein